MLVPQLVVNGLQIICIYTAAELGGYGATVVNGLQIICIYTSIIDELSRIIVVNSLQTI